MRGSTALAAWGLAAFVLLRRRTRAAVVAKTAGGQMMASTGLFGMKQVGFPSAVHHSLALPRSRAGALQVEGAQQVPQTHCCRRSSSGTRRRTWRSCAACSSGRPGIRWASAAGGDFALADSSVGALTLGGDPFPTCNDVSAHRPADVTCRPRAFCALGVEQPVHPHADCLLFDARTLPHLLLSTACVRKPNSCSHEPVQTLSNSPAKCRQRHTGQVGARGYRHEGRRGGAPPRDPVRKGPFGRLAFQIVTQR